MSHSSRKRVKVSDKAGEVVVGRPKTQRRPRTWLLIADGKGADLYDVEPVTLRLRAIPDGRIRQDDMPGRLLKIGNRSHHKLDLRKSPHQLTEDTFLRLVAREVIARASASNPDDLMIAAPPKAMAILRKELKPALGDRISLEVTHEWNRLSKEDITDRLRDTLTGHDPHERKKSRKRPSEIGLDDAPWQLTPVKVARWHRR